MKEPHMDTVMRVINGSSSVEITNDEAERLNGLPADETVSILRQLFERSGDDVTQSRALDALLKIKDFDKVHFLIDSLDKPTDVDWRMAFCRRLADLCDRRALEKLCEVLLNDPDPDVRFVAAESLAVIGDETAISALERTMQHDRGKDYEGFPVSSAARAPVK